MQHPIGGVRSSPVSLFEVPGLTPAPTTPRRWFALPGIRFALAVAAILLVAVSQAQGDVYWSASAGDWSVASNWGGTLPTGSDTACIANGGTASVTQLGETCGTLRLGGSAGSGTLQMTGGSLYATSYQYVGDSGTGIFTQSGGTNSIGGTLWLGNNPGGSGTYNLSGSGLLSAAYEEIGFSGGAGSFTQSGGTHSVSGELFLGPQPGSSGTYNLSGSGLLSADIEFIGFSGSGAFNQSGGTNTLTGVSPLLTGQGTYSLTGGALVVPAMSGISTFNFGGGTLVASASFSTSQAMALTGSGGNATINSGSNAVTLTGALSGSGGLNEWGAGSGQLILSGSNDYTGGTTVEAGTLCVSRSNALPDGSSLIIGAGGPFAPDLSAAGAGEAASGRAAPGEVVAAVPEPGTLALLSVAGIVAVAAAWQRRK
jgi:autotransporter-associated beta strand protein